MSSVAEFGENLCTFSASVYGNIIASQQEKQVNTLFCPLSIYTALAMTLVGSKSSTEDELRQALRLPTPVNHDTVGNYLSKYWAEAKDVELNNANRLILIRAAQINETFKTDLVKKYNAECESLASMPNDEARREHINQWVAKVTKEKIKELLPRGAVDPNSILMLINALYFKGSWKNQFPVAQTKAGTFRKHDNSTCEIEMMHDEQDLPYEELEDIAAQALKLPFQGDDSLEMLIVLPFGVDGLPEVLQYLQNPENMKKLLSQGFHQKKVKVILPKFKLFDHPAVDLIAILKQMGVEKLFDCQKADLSGISTEMQLFVSGIFHKAVLEVDEKGATAAAATAIRVNTRALIRNPIFKVDRPFFLAIVRDKTVPIFMGHIWEPEKL